MIKYKIAFCSAVAVLFATTVTGAFGVSIVVNSEYRVKCVRLNSSSTCSTATVADNSRDWSTSCGTATVKGIMACGEWTDLFSAPAIGTKQTSVTHDISGGGSNIACWCRMITPALSKYWVSAAAASDTDTTIFYISEEECFAGCAQRCVTLLNTNSTFKTAMFSSME